MLSLTKEDNEEKNLRTTVYFFSLIFYKEGTTFFYLDGMELGRLVGHDTLQACCDVDWLSVIWAFVWGKLVLAVFGLTSEILLYPAVSPIQVLTRLVSAISLTSSKVCTCCMDGKLECLHPLLSIFDRLNQTRCALLFLSVHR